MIVLGIDPGTATTGYGVVQGDDRALQLLAHGAVVTSPRQPLPERLLIIHQEVARLIRTHGPQAVAVEELFFGRNAPTALAVGHARGVVLLAAAQAGVPVFTYTPATVKQAIVGYGGADKHQMQEMIRLLLGLPAPLRPDDVADAVAVAICHIHSRQIEQLLTSTAGQ